MMVDVMILSVEERTALPYKEFTILCNNCSLRLCAFMLVWFTRDQLKLPQERIRSSVDGLDGIESTCMCYKLIYGFKTLLQTE